MPTERDHEIAAQHREIARLSREAVDPLAGGRLAASCRGAATRFERLAELFDPPDAAEKPETPEPTGLGELLDRLQVANLELCSFGHSCEVTDNPSISVIDRGNDKLKDTRQAVVDFVARQRMKATEDAEDLRLELSRTKDACEHFAGSRDDLATENERLKAGNEAIKSAFETVEDELNELREGANAGPERKLGEATSTECAYHAEEVRECDPICQVRDEKGVAYEICGECPDFPGSVRCGPCEKTSRTRQPERKPGDVWCALHDRATTPDSRPCEDRAHHERPARQKTNTHAGWSKGVIQKCEHCLEIRTEPGEIPDGAVRWEIPENTYSVRVYIYPDEESDRCCADVPRLPGCHTFGDTIDEVLAMSAEALTGCLKSYLADGEIPWLPLEETPPCPPGAIERVVTVKVEPDAVFEPMLPKHASERVERRLREMGLAEEPQPDEPGEFLTDTFQATSPGTALGGPEFAFGDPEPASDPPAAGTPPETLPRLSGKMQKLVTDCLRAHRSNHDWTKSRLEYGIRELEANQLDPGATRQCGDCEWVPGPCRPCVYKSKQVTSEDAVEANLRPPATPLGTSIQAAIDALPVTLRADATDMARVATAAGEPVLGLRLLVSVKNELLDPTATCGECISWALNKQGGPYCKVTNFSYRPRQTACVQIQRKAESVESSEESETESMALDTPPGNQIVFRYPTNGFLDEQRTASKHLTVGETYTVDEIDIGQSRSYVRLREGAGVSFDTVMFANAKEPAEPESKARFFRLHNFLWVYPERGRAWYFDPTDKYVELAAQSLEYTTTVSRAKAITEAEAIAILTKADWSKGLEKLRELIGGEDEST